jgi:hypothetical protein
MIKINFPSHPFRTKKEGEKEFIFDEVRKLWVRLSPEEWVRQNFLQYLIGEKKYPSSWVAVEREMKLGELSKRFDILVFDHSAKPYMMVECKAMQVDLTEKTLDQIVRYNLAMPVPILIVTNGTHTFGFKIGMEGATVLEEIPALEPR